MAQQTFYWHDYETWGADPSRDRASQFAGLRTDAELNVIGEPLVIYCRPTPDVLPQPDACLVTGITPQQALAEGLSERDFIARIHAELAKPGTCGVGYNSIRFDDEVTRYTLYRNFYDPYAREWQGGNSRWDLIDVVRLCCALRPEGIEWPRREDGTPSFKLEELTRANGLAHESAHDALSDVQATIALARLVRDKKPKLYDYALGLRRKQRVAEVLDLAQQKPVLHISGRIAAARYCSALVMPLAMHPVNRNSIIAYDLMCDPEPLLQLGAAEVARRVFSSADELEGEERIPLKEIHLNKSAMLVTVSAVDEAAAQRLQIDLERCRRHWQQIRNAPELRGKLRDIYSAREFEDSSDPEQSLYGGGFLSDEDRALSQRVVAADAEALREQSFPFSDARLPELLFRYRARNFPDSLSAEEQAQWREFCYQRLHDPAAGASITLGAFRQRLAELQAERPSPRDQGIVEALVAYADALEAGELEFAP